MLLAVLVTPGIVLPQIGRPPVMPPPPPPAASTARPNQRVAVPRPNAPPPGEWLVRAVTQEMAGSVRKLRGHVELESSEMLFRADELDYNEATGYVEARGNVYFQHFTRNEELWADKVEYHLDDETGNFYNVRGSGQPRIDARPGVLTSTNPFHFEGEWAERLSEKYILHNGWVTDCKIPNPWWKLSGPKFDIVPGERAIAYRSVFRVRKFPLFFTPVFYKSLEKVPRRSGFLTPNIGNSSRRGKMIGVGYYWAINRSYDATYRLQDFTARGLAHHLELRGKPYRGADFDAIIYGVQDRGLELPDGTRRQQGGYDISAGGKAELPFGFQARGSLSYLSSLEFRQAFTESFNEAIFSEVHSVGVITRHWSSFTFNTVFARLENFQSIAPGDSVTIRKLPEFEFSSRDRRIWKDIPVWVSFDTTAGLLHRRNSCVSNSSGLQDPCSAENQPYFETRSFLDRLNVEPRITTALHWKDFHLVPSFTIHETHYGERFGDGRIVGENILRSAREMDVQLIFPTLQRTFDKKTWLGEKLKHVIEPRASFRHVDGIQDFNEIIRFDETELISNTTEAEVSVTNRFYAKRGNVVSEVLSWQVAQRRYFDPDFGGAVIPGQRNVVLSSITLTPYTFLDGPRTYSPVVSVLRAMPLAGLGFEWRTDYDPKRRGIVNSGFTTDFRRSKYFISAGHNQVHSIPFLSPSSNQVRGVLGLGNTTSKGWNAAFTAIYDYRIGIMQFATTQVTYNTDCCGISFQYRRFNFGARNENQFRVAFAVANIGSFGTLKKQERLF
jgi:LPS-assembly protein